MLVPFWLERKSTDENTGLGTPFVIYRREGQAAPYKTAARRRVASFLFDCLCYPCLKFVCPLSSNDGRANRVEQFEANELRRAERDEEEGDSDDDSEALEFRKLEAGAYTQQRLAVVMVVISAHSSAVAKRVNEKLHQVRTSCAITGAACLAGTKNACSCCVGCFVRLRRAGGFAASIAVGRSTLRCPPSNTLAQPLSSSKVAARATPISVV